MSASEVRPYADGWEALYAAGWGPLPLPPGRKAPPPRGWTGRTAPMPSGADCSEWAELYPGANVGLRVPAGVMMLDVDDYVIDGKVKRGAATIVEHERQAGPLPPTWKITSRDGPSGRYPYRVPASAGLVTALPDVEVIQTHHRYSVAPPSTNGADAGRPVLCFDPVGRLAPVPAVDLLPELPAAWLELLRADGEQVAPLALDRNGVLAFWSALPPGSPCTAVRERLAAAERAARGLDGGSRHDRTLVHVLALLRLGEQGHPGVAAVVPRLRDAYVASVADRASPALALAEFARFCRPEAIGRLLARPTSPNRRLCDCPEGVAALLDKITDPVLRAEIAADLEALS